jgi:CRP-like cAMP-binding protein
LLSTSVPETARDGEPTGVYRKVACSQCVQNRVRRSLCANRSARGQDLPSNAGRYMAEYSLLVLDSVSLQHFLARVPALQRASSELLMRMAGDASVRTLHRGEYLWRAGDTPAAFMAIRSGLIKIVRGGARGRSTLCGCFGPPESLGELALLKSIVYPADALVATPKADVVLIPATSFLDCMSRSTELAMSVALGMHGKVHSLHTKVDVLSAGSVEARLATALLKFYEQFGDELEDGTHIIPVALSRRDLAELVSTSCESTTRMMTRWEREGVLDTEQSGFRIRKLAELQAVCARGHALPSTAGS